MKRARIVAAGVLVLLFAIVVAQNTESVRTEILFWTVPMPRAVLLLVLLAVGFACGLLVGGAMKRGRRGG